MRCTCRLTGGCSVCGSSICEGCGREIKAGETIVFEEGSPRHSGCSDLKSGDDDENTNDTD